MKKDAISYFFILTYVGIVNLAAAASSVNLIQFESAEIEIANQRFNVEIARSYRQRLQGLMFREDLPQQKAMLFLYPFKGDHRIWMKNTLIPLTVVWLDSNAIVLAVKQLTPCQQDPCSNFGANSASHYVLELPAGFSELKVGDRVPDILKLVAQ